MISIRNRIAKSGTLGLALMLGSSGVLEAQNRLVLPRGAVIIVRTATPIESSSARVGQTFYTNILDSLGIDGYTVIPAGSRIRGVVRTVTPASRSQSGVIEVAFDQLQLTDGTVFL